MGDLQVVSLRMARLRGGVIMRRKLVPIGALCAGLLALLLIEVPHRSRTNLQNFYYYDRSHYSQFSEEFAIRCFFKDKTNGFFIDAGASHYSRNSTTYFLEKESGWRGNAVDPAEHGH